MTALTFHLSLLVDDLDAAADFYGDTLGCPMGRRAPTWFDVDFFGHQLSLHAGQGAPLHVGVVEGVRVPMPHFGVLLDPARWHALVRRLEELGVLFVVAPQVRFAGEPHEQATFFVADPAGNHIEFKGLPPHRDVLAVEDGEVTERQST